LLVDWCLTALSAQAGYIVPQEYEIYMYDEGPGTTQTHNKTMKQYTKLKDHKRSSAWALWG